jgi:hypothetical protein
MNFKSKTYKVLQTDLNLPHMLDSSVCCLKKSILKCIPTYIRVWYTASTYFASDMTNSEGFALQKQMLKHLTGKAPEK